MKLYKDLIEEKDYEPSEEMKEWNDLINRFILGWGFTDEQKHQTRDLFAKYMQVVFKEGQNSVLEDIEIIGASIKGGNKANERN